MRSTLAASRGGGQAVRHRHLLLTEAEGPARELARTVVGQHGGFELDTDGDSLLVAFARARDGVAAAVGIQRATRSIGRLRIGISSAEAIATDEGYTGLGVRGAESIRSAAHAGQILLSQTTRDLLRETPLDTTEVRDLGEHRLKDLTAASAAVQLVDRRPRRRVPARCARSRTGRRTCRSSRRRSSAASARSGEVAELLRPTRCGCSRSPAPAARARRGSRSRPRPSSSTTSPTASSSSASRRSHDPGLVLPTIAQTLGRPRERRDARRGSRPASARPASSCWCSTTSSICSRPHRRSRELAAAAPA